LFYFITNIVNLFFFSKINNKDVEKERLEKETRTAEKNAWKSKLKGHEYFYTYNKDIKKEAQVDRYKVC